MASIYKQKSSRYYWICYKDPDNPGKHKRKSLRTSDKQIAKRLCKQYAEQEKPDRRGPKKKMPVLSELVEQWIAVTKIESSDRQADHKKLNWAQYQDYTGIKETYEISRQSIDKWMIHLDDSGLSPKTIKNKIGCITSFCSFLVEREMMDRTPRIRSPRIQKRPPRYLTAKQAAEVLQTARGIGNTLYLAVLIAIKSGLRMSEIRRLDHDDFHWSENVVVIPKTKSNRPRSVPIHPDITAELKPLAVSGPLFKSPKKGKDWPYYDASWFVALIKPLQAAKPEIFTDGQGEKSTGRAWHLFRHTFASRLVQAGVDLYKVSKWMGHSNISTTMIYAHLAPVHDDDINLA